MAVWYGMASSFAFYVVELSLALCGIFGTPCDVLSSLASYCVCRLWPCVVGNFIVVVCRLLRRHVVLYYLWPCAISIALYPHVIPSLPKIIKPRVEGNMTAKE